MVGSIHIADSAHRFHLIIFECFLIPLEEKSFDISIGLSQHCCTQATSKELNTKASLYIFLQSWTLEQSLFWSIQMGVNVMGIVLLENSLKENIQVSDIDLVDLRSTDISVKYRMQLLC